MPTFADLPLPAANEYPYNLQGDQTKARALSAAASQGDTDALARLKTLGLDAGANLARGGDGGTTEAPRFDPSNFADQYRSDTLSFARQRYEDSKAAAARAQAFSEEIQRRRMTLAEQQFAALRGGAAGAGGVGAGGIAGRMAPGGIAGPAGGGIRDRMGAPLQAGNIQQLQGGGAGGGARVKGGGGKRGSTGGIPLSDWAKEVRERRRERQDDRADAQAAGEEYKNPDRAKLESDAREKKEWEDYKKKTAPKTNGGAGETKPDAKPRFAPNGAPLDQNGNPTSGYDANGNPVNSDGTKIPKMVKAYGNKHASVMTKARGDLA